MNQRTTLISLAVLFLCGTLLVLFTDIEVSAVRWFNCGPFAAAGDRRSEVCR